LEINQIVLGPGERMYFAAENWLRQEPGWMGKRACSKTAQIVV